MAHSNTKSMAVQEEVDHAPSYAHDASHSDHVVIKNDTFAIDEAALGENLPKHYYRSIGFIGTVAVCDLEREVIPATDLCRHYVSETLATIWVGSCLRTLSP